MFNPGDLIKSKDKGITIQFEVISVDIYNWYMLKVIQEDAINFPYHYINGLVGWPQGYLMDYEVMNKQTQNNFAYKNLDNAMQNSYGYLSEKKEVSHSCSCGAYKVGYTKEGRSHSHYCKMYKE